MNAEDLKLGFAGAATALAAILALFVLFSTGTALGAEVGNETVTVGNDTETIDVEATWSETANTDNVTSTVEVRNSSGSVVHQTAMPVADNETINVSINVTDAGLDNADYTVALMTEHPDTGTDGTSYVESWTAIASTGSSSGGGGFLADASNKKIAAGVLLVIAVGLILKEGN
jgi:hypothetical protein